MKEVNMITAKQINDLLENDGVVIVSTYLKNFTYTKKHAGWFFTGKDKNLYVKSGKGSNCLTSQQGKNFLVAIKGYKQK